MTLLLAALLARSAFAGDPAPPAGSPDDAIEVLVAPFQARATEVVGVASLLHDYLEQELDHRDDLKVVPVARAGMVFDQTAELYLASCPPTDEVGCAIAVAESAKVPYAVTGFVEIKDGKPHIHVWVLDIGRMRQVEFERDLVEGQDDALVAEASKTVLAVVHDQAGVPVDERFLSHKTDAELADEAARSAEKQALDAEKTDPNKLGTRKDVEATREKYTASDLQARMEVEGSKPWERLDMSPSEYMHYKNSGMNLADWRTRAAGRKGQLVIRPGLGLLRAPVHEEYYGRYVRDSQTLAVVQRYAWQGVSTGSGVCGVATISYGVLPILEVGLTGGLVGAQYQVDIASVKEGDDPIPEGSSTYSSHGLFVGPSVLADLLPTSVVRPVVGGAFLLWRGTKIDDHNVAPPEDLQVFDPTSLGMVELRVGAELRLSQQIDLYLHVPIQAVVFGGDPQVQSDGADYLTGTDTPTSPDAVSAGVLVGFQVKLFGPKAPAKTLDDYGDE